MQSTGHSSMHARSSTSTQGRAMMYVTYELLFHTAGGAPVRRHPTQVSRIMPASRSLPGSQAIAGYSAGIAGYQPNATPALAAGPRAAPVAVVQPFLPCAA